MKIERRVFKFLVQVPNHEHLTAWRQGDISALKYCTSRKIQKFLSKQSAEEREALWERVDQARYNNLLKYLMGLSEARLEIFWQACELAYPGKFADHLEAENAAQLSEAVQAMEDIA